jgi:hypothetical protein
MQARYTRLFTNACGAATFEDLAIELGLGFAVPPAEPLHSAAFLPASRIFWVGGSASWKGDTAHPAPRRMVFVTVQGEYRIEASDGVTRTFPPGSVLLIEDTTGTGHSTRITSAADAIVLAVELSATAS